MLVLINGLPPMGTALARAKTDDDIGWSMTDHLLASVVDALRLANWQRAANSSDSNRPNPIQRPGDTGRRITDEQAETLMSIVARRWEED